MKRNLINSLVATFITAALALGTLTACSVDDLLGQKTIVKEAPVCRITLPASFDNGAQTRAVTIGEKKARTTFAETDEVYMVIEHDGVYAIAYDPAERKCVSMTVTPGSNPSEATLSGALKFYYDDGDRNPIALTPAEGDAVYLFYNMRLPDLNPAYLNFNYLYQTGSKDQKVASYWDYHYGATYHDYGEAKMKIAALDGDDSEGYTMSLVQFDNPDESDVNFQNVGSLFRQELTFKDKNGDSVTPTLTQFVVTTAENNTIYMYYPLASTEENRYIRGPVALDPHDLSDDGNIYFAMMFVDDIKNETLYITAEDEDGNVYTASKAAPAGGFENGKYYYGKLELTWQKCKAPTVTGTTVKPIYGNYELTENPVNITISGYSEEYEFRLENGQGGTFTLDNLTAYGYIFINQKHIYPDPQGDVSLVLKGDNSIYANDYWGILLYGGLKMSCIGASATITITTTADNICGLSCSNYRNDVDYDNPAYNRNTDESETDVTDLLAAPGFTVTRSAPTKAYDSTYGQEIYTYTYTVESHLVDLSQLTGNYVAQDGDWLTGTLAGDYKISVADGATVTLSGITINGGNDWDTDWAGITCEGDATLVLADGTDNLVRPFLGSRAAISVPDGKTLTIQGSGSLTADSHSDSGGTAGIGGDTESHYGNIVITGAANVTAYAGPGSAGIGSGDTVPESPVVGGDITISTTGTVTAYGGDNGAGIGGGISSYSAASRCGNILITKGTIVATGGTNCPGIGSGYAMDRISTCGTITITDGVTKVTATRGTTNDVDACCIGPNSYQYCGTVTIGGTVYWGPKDSDPTQYEFKNGGESYLKTDMLIYEP